METGLLPDPTCPCRTPPQSFLLQPVRPAPPGCPVSVRPWRPLQWPWLPSWTPCPSSVHTTVLGPGAALTGHWSFQPAAVRLKFLGLGFRSTTEWTIGGGRAAASCSFRALNRGLHRKGRRPRPARVQAPSLGPAGLPWDLATDMRYSTASHILEAREAGGRDAGRAGPWEAEPRKRAKSPARGAGGVGLAVGGKGDGSRPPRGKKMRKRESLTFLNRGF